MTITKADSQKMQRLAQEGKTIIKIFREDFPKESYWDVYFEVYGGGERSSLGIKRMITARINAMGQKTRKSGSASMADDPHWLALRLDHNPRADVTKPSKIF